MKKKKEKRLYCLPWLIFLLIFVTAFPAYGGDADGDGVEDSIDNCLSTSNLTQLDTDGDGYGNACDADLNNDGIVNTWDLALFKKRFGTSDADADFNEDGIVNTWDLAKK